MWDEEREWVLSHNVWILRATGQTAGSFALLSTLIIGPPLTVDSLNLFKPVLGDTALLRHLSRESGLPNTRPGT